jgi:glycosyltransferase involved in cell wall biosynthesis
MKILAIIPATNSNFLDRCIECLSACDVDIIVMKNTEFKMSDHFSYFVEKNKRVKVISPANKEDTGFASSINHAINFYGGRGGYDGYLIINQDVQLSKAAFEDMVTEMEQCHDVGLIFPRETTVKRGQLFDCTVMVNYKPDGFFKWTHCPEGQYLYGNEGFSFFCVLIRSECLKDIGMLNEGFFAGGEDVEFCARVFVSRWKTKLAKCTAFHSQASAAQEATDNGQDFQEKMKELVKKIILNPATCKVPVRKESKKRIHLLGFAHTKANDDYSYCAFTQLNRLFTKMMMNEGWEIVYYGVEGSDIECTDFVQCLSHDEFMKTYGRNEEHKYQYDHEWTQGDAWPLFVKRCQDVLNKSLPNKEIVCVTGGGCHRSLLGTNNAIMIDPHVGHKNPITNYRVFPSKTWRSFVYGLMDEQMCRTYPPTYWMDAVIYHYLNMDEIPPLQPKEDYALFVGRLNFDKGLYEAMTACSAIGMKLKIVGAIDPSTEEYFYSRLKENEDYCEYLGTKKKKELYELMAKAKCQIATSYYHEPFGLVAIEAMACGTPIITTDWGAFSETNKHGVTGYRIAFYDEIKRYLNLINQGESKFASFDIQRWAKANFDYRVAGKFYSRYFDRVLKYENTGGNGWYKAELPSPLVQDLKTGIGDL